MAPRHHDVEEPGAAGSPPSLDRRVLLGTLVFALVMFVAMWFGSRGFLPGAQLFPDALAAVGLLVTLVALLRVWRGIEPAESPGQGPREEAESADVYRKALLYLGGIAVYYVGVLVIGFLPATALLLFLVARAYSQSYRYAIASTVAGVGAVWALGTLLDLYLPLGWIVELFVGG